MNWSISVESWKQSSYLTRISWQTLDLEESLRLAMMSMSSAQFETVLHPVFQVSPWTTLIMQSTWQDLSSVWHCFIYDLDFPWPLPSAGGWGYTYRGRGGTGGPVRPSTGPFLLKYCSCSFTAVTAFSYAEQHSYRRAVDKKHQYIAVAIIRTIQLRIMITS